MDVNMYHPTAMLKTFLPDLSKRLSNHQHSGIILVSSVASYVAIPAAAAYGASKAYVSYLALAISKELSASNIDMQVFCPNFVDTGMVQGVPVPFYSLQVASPSSVVSASIRQLGHKRLPGELPTTAGTALHEILNRSLRFIHENSPIFVTKMLTYITYNK